MPNASVPAKSRLIRLLPNLTGWFLAVMGSIILAWVAWLAWSDMASWGKDITFVFFGSRTGEAISLGIGMRMIHYFLIGLALLLSSSIIFLRRWIKAKRAHKMSEGVVVTIPKVMVDDIRRQAWFNHYRDIGDFILNAVKRSIENWENWEKGELPKR